MQNNMEVAMNPDLLSKKQAIHYALCTVLTEEEAESALNNWMQSISTSASLFSGLNLFARNVCETYGKCGRHVELVQAMSRALMTGNFKPEVSLFKPAPPLPMIADTDESGEEELFMQEISTPEFASFQLMLLNLLNLLTQHNAEVGSACREFLMGVVSNLPWSDAQQKQLVKLLKTGTTIQTRTYRSGQLKVLLNHLAVWMDEALGNSLAESITRHAIGETEKSQVAIAYSPHEFFA